MVYDQILFFLLFFFLFCFLWLFFFVCLPCLTRSEVVPLSYFEVCDRWRIFLHVVVLPADEDHQAGWLPPGRVWVWPLGLSRNAPLGAGSLSLQIILLGSPAHYAGIVWGLVFFV